MASPRIGNALLHGRREGERWQHSLDGKPLRMEVRKGNVVKVDEFRRQARAAKARQAFACSPRAMDQTATRARRVATRARPSWIGTCR